MPTAQVKQDGNGQPLTSKVRVWLLVKILIVGIVLSVLVRIVAPQFTNAADDPRTDWTRDPVKHTIFTLKTIRGQIDLFKLQHHDKPPNMDNGWAIMINKSNANDIQTPDNKGMFGPYLATYPKNPLNDQTAIGSVPNKKIGWVYNSDTGDIQAVNKDGSGVLPY